VRTDTPPGAVCPVPGGGAVAVSGNETALRQFRHFLFVVGLWLITAAGNIAGGRGAGSDKYIADLRARRWRKRDSLRRQRGPQK